MSAALPELVGGLKCDPERNGTELQMTAENNWCVIRRVKCKFVNPIATFTVAIPWQHQLVEYKIALDSTEKGRSTVLSSRVSTENVAKIFDLRYKVPVNVQAMPAYK